MYNYFFLKLETEKIMNTSTTTFTCLCGNEASKNIQTIENTPEAEINVIEYFFKTLPELAQLHSITKKKYETMWQSKKFAKLVSLLPHLIMCTSGKDKEIQAIGDFIETWIDEFLNRVNSLAQEGITPIEKTPENDVIQTFAKFTVMTKNKGCNNNHFNIAINHEDQEGNNDCSAQ